MKTGTFHIGFSASVRYLHTAWRPWHTPEDGAMLMAQAERVDLIFKNPMKG